MHQTVNAALEENCVPLAQGYLNLGYVFRSWVQM